MQVQENISLKLYNSFHIDAAARYLAVVKTVEDLQNALALHPQLPKMILGGGSNMLLTKDVDSVVIKNEIKGIEKVKEDEDYVYIKAGAGEPWHGFVLYCIENGWAGVENLSLIPGCVGASPIQNIGAYGVEIKDVLHEVKAFHIQEKANYTFSLKDCAFGYRESIFKIRYKGQFVITHVTYRLRKQPIFTINYGAIKEELEKMGVKELSIRAISQAVITIRSSKLPDPALIGNAGSFFKNPCVPKEQFLILKETYPAIVGFDNPDGTVKLAAGWLIEQCGWKGYRDGDAGVHVHQALVLVNYGNASGEEIYSLSESILQSVMKKFGVTLEREVNIF